MSGRVHHLTQRHVAWPFAQCIHEPLVVTGVGTNGITCSLGSAEPRDLKCVILGPKMTYTTGLGSVEPSLMQKCNLHPYFSTCKKPPITPFFPKTIGGTMGLPRLWPKEVHVVVRRKLCKKGCYFGGTPQEAFCRMKVPMSNVCQYLHFELHTRFPNAGPNHNKMGSTSH